MDAERKPQSAAVYCRISQDRGGEGLGVERQEYLCRELAERKGWAVGQVYTDNDLSAFRGKARPAYARLLADLASGARDGVIVVDHDRLTRHPSELEAFIELADKLGIALANVSGDLDLSSSDGRFRARIMGAVARQESEKKSERIRRERDQAARAGKPHGGRRPFGYERGGMRVRPDEAELVREAARRFLSGEPLRIIAEDINARGIRSPSGRLWTIEGFKAVLTGPRAAGLRVHRGEVVGPAQWPALIDGATWEALRAALRDPRRRMIGRPATNLLSGMLVCGRCGAVLRSTKERAGARRYACNKAPGRLGCGRLAITAEPVEREVRDQVLAALAGPELAGALRAAMPDRGQQELMERLRADEQAQEQLAVDFYTDRLITRAEFLAARDALEARIASARRALARDTSRALLAELPSDEQGLRALWDAADIEWRRALLRAVVERVVIAPATRRGRGAELGRIELRWRA